VNAGLPLQQAQVTGVVFSVAKGLAPRVRHLGKAFHRVSQQRTRRPAHEVSVSLRGDVLNWRLPVDSGKEQTGQQVRCPFSHFRCRLPVDE